MAFFDDPRPRRSPLRSAAAAIAAHPGSFVAFVVATAIVAAAALLALFATDGGVRQLGTLADRTELSVYLRPDAAPADVEATGELARKNVDVLDVRAVSKDDAMAALGAAGFPALPARPNPLPDSFVVRLRPTVGPGAASARFTAAAKALAALPGVESAVYDERWLARIDAWSTRAGEAIGAVRLGAFSVLALAAACIAWLAIGACRAPEAPPETDAAHGWAAGALVGFAGSLVAVIGAWTLGWLVVSRLVAMPPAAKPMADWGGHSLDGANGWLLLSVVFVGVVVGAVRGAME